MTLKARDSVASLCLVLALCGCGRDEGERAPSLGDAARGRALLRQYGCDACHEIPGVRDAIGHVGPPLAGIGKRLYLGGTLPNTPSNMRHWLRAPRQVRPDGAMPDLGVSERDAADMAAYLHELR